MQRKSSQSGPSRHVSDAQPYRLAPSPFSSGPHCLVLHTLGVSPDELPWRRSCTCVHVVVGMRLGTMSRNERGCRVRELSYGNVPVEVTGHVDAMAAVGVVKMAHRRRRGCRP